MKRNRISTVKYLLALAVLGIVVGLVFPLRHDPCVGNPDEFEFKKLALRYHFFFAEHKRSPSGGRELAAFVPRNLGPHLTSESIDCANLLKDEYDGLVYVQWNAALLPTSDANAEYILAYRVSPDAEGQWAVRGDGSPVYLTTDEFANIEMIPTATVNADDGG